jgi:hypothetical protein
MTYPPGFAEGILCCFWASWVVAVSKGVGAGAKGIEWAGLWGLAVVGVMV